jgi:hypothetical protein
VHTLAPQWRRVLVGSWIMIGVLTIALVVLYVDNKRTRECIANYMTADQQNTQARSELADKERTAFNHLLVVLLDQRNTQAVRKSAFEGYVILVQQDDLLRKQRPPLPVPTECA